MTPRSHNPNFDPYDTAPSQHQQSQGFPIDGNGNNGRKKTIEEKPLPKSGWWKRLCAFANALVLITNILCALGLIFTAYAERISPVEWKLAVVVTMTLPVWVCVIVLLLVADLMWWKRTAIVPGIAILICISQITAFSPLNLPHLHMTDKEKANSFTLLSYNVYTFLEFDNSNYGESRHINYILEQDADIVCLQEAQYLSPNKQNMISQRQLDQLHERYPYVLTSGRDFAILSKYSVQPISINFPSKEFKSGDMAAWRADINGRIVNIFSVHLRSLSLTDTDKNAYGEIISLDDESKRTIIRAARKIIPKLEIAGVERVKQIELLKGYLDRYGGTDAIICGDFNDPVGAYSLYYLEDKCRMRQAYAKTGFGPMITYYGNRLYFRIDHVLYRGKMWPYSMHRGHVKASDHYPLTTTFVFD